MSLSLNAWFASMVLRQQTLTLPANENRYTTELFTLCSHLRPTQLSSPGPLPRTEILTILRYRKKAAGIAGAVTAVFCYVVMMDEEVRSRTVGCCA